MLRILLPLLFLVVTFWIILNNIYTCLVRVFITVMKHHDQKKSVEERVYFACFHIVVHHSNEVPGEELETVEECYLLAFLYHLE